MREDRRTNEEVQGRSVIEKMKEIERSIEWKERKDRRKNIIVRNMEVLEEKKRESLEELMREIGAEVKIEDINKLRIKEKGKDMWQIKLGSEEQKRDDKKEERTKG